MFRIHPSLFTSQHATEPNPNGTIDRHVYYSFASVFLQDYIDKLVGWSETWQMLKNLGKCKCLHTGSRNTGMNYGMGGTILSKTVKEKDLGVAMNANMKVSEQCRIAASLGNQILGMIRRNITYKEKSLIVPLYKVIVRRH